MFRTLEELQVYRISEELADDIWNLVLVWEGFPKNTVGKQMVRAADSVPANLSEGYGRYSFKENVQFCYYARGSLFETKNWLRRAGRRKLISEVISEKYLGKIEFLGKKLNAYINSIKKQYAVTHQ